MLVLFALNARLSYNTLLKYLSCYFSTRYLGIATLTCTTSSTSLLKIPMIMQQVWDYL